MVLDNLFVITGLSCPFSLPGNGFRFPSPVPFLNIHCQRKSGRRISQHPPQYGHLKALSAIPGLFLYIPFVSQSVFPGCHPCGNTEGKHLSRPLLFNKIDHAKRNPFLQHGCIVRLFPDIILFHKFFGFALIHGFQIIRIQPAVFPQVFFAPPIFSPKSSCTPANLHHLQSV